MSQNGKGDTYRPHDPDRFGREYERIFGRSDALFRAEAELVEAAMCRTLAHLDAPYFGAPEAQDPPGSPAESPQPEPAPRPV